MMSVLMYVCMDGCEAWAARKEQKSRSRIQATQMIVLRRIEGVCWRNRVTNEEVATSGGVRCGEKETGGIMEIQIG